MTSKKKYEVVKTYMSPWERAMKGDKELMATMKIQMPGPIVEKDIPKYKCFNRWAVSTHSLQLNIKLMSKLQVR